MYDLQVLYLCRGGCASSFGPPAGTGRASHIGPSRHAGLSRGRAPYGCGGERADGSGQGRAFHAICAGCQGAAARLTRPGSSPLSDLLTDTIHASQLVLGEQTLLKYRGKVISLHSQ